MYAITGQFSIGYALRCVLLIGVTPFVDILKFYAVMLLVAPAAIFVVSRYRFGLLGLISLSLLPHLAYPILTNLPAPPSVFGGDYLSFPASFAYGGAVGAGGPSLLHGFFFVCVGMLIGRLAESLLSATPGDATRARRGFAALLLISGAASVAMWNWQAPLATVYAISDMSLRNLNHPQYFALGAFAMTSSAWLALELYDRRDFTFGRGVAFIGSTSLFTFSFGNMLLIIAPHMNLSAHSSMVYGLTLLAAVLALSWLFRKALITGAERRLEGETDVTVYFYIFQTSLVTTIQTSITPLAIFYARRLVLSEGTKKRD